MRSQAMLVLYLVLAESLAAARARPPVEEDTIAPNVFWFSQSEYAVSESETNLVVTVDWSPGNRSYTGWVDYFATNGTATPGADYTSVTGRLVFSDPGPQSFSIPIHADSVSEGEETIQLLLWHPDAVITTNNAVVIIRDFPAAPEIDIASSSNQVVLLSWPGQPSEFILETTAAPDGNWMEVPTLPSQVNGRCEVSLASSEPMAFFRLKKAPVNFSR